MLTPLKGVHFISVKLISCPHLTETENKTKKGNQGIVCTKSMGGSSQKDKGKNKRCLHRDEKKWASMFTLLNYFALFSTRLYLKQQRQDLRAI